LDLGVRSAAAFPLIVQGDESVGVLGVLARRDIDEEEFAHIGILAQQAAISIKSAQVFEENKQLRDRLLVENAYLQEEIRSEVGFSEIIGGKSDAAGAAQRDPAGRGHGLHGAAAGRNRDREGAHRQGGPSIEFPPGPAPHQGELRGHRAGPGGE
jgi:GAF domain-containing protein